MVTEDALSRGRVRIADVARQAGVGQGTASDALNGRGRISDGTRKRIADIAAEMGYRPQSNAKALRSGRTMSLGMRFGGKIVPQAEFIVDLLNGASTAAHGHGYGLMISAPELNEHELFDGLVVVDPISEEEVNISGMKVMTVGRAPGQNDVPFVDIDYRTGVRALLDTAQVGASDGPVWFLMESSEAAYNDYLTNNVTEWCLDNGREAAMLECSSQEYSVVAALDAHIESFGNPAIVVGPTSRHADVAQRHLQEIGLRVPEDVRIASGLADSQADASDPPIPAMDGDGWGHGRMVVDAMVKWLETGERPMNIVITPRLVQGNRSAVGE
jgi:DNA-binding LacI/PurR family transcriptional regulator